MLVQTKLPHHPIWVVHRKYVDAYHRDLRHPDPRGVTANSREVLEDLLTVRLQCHLITNISNFSEQLIIFMSLVIKFINEIEVGIKCYL